MHPSQTSGSFFAQFIVLCSKKLRQQLHRELQTVRRHGRCSMAATWSTSSSTSGDISLRLCVPCSCHLSSQANWHPKRPVRWELQLDKVQCHTLRFVEATSLLPPSPYQPWAVSAAHGAARHTPCNIVRRCCLKSLCVVEGKALHMRHTHFT